MWIRSVAILLQGKTPCEIGCGCGTFGARRHGHEGQGPGLLRRGGGGLGMDAWGEKATLGSKAFMSCVGDVRQSIWRLCQSSGGAFVVR